MNLQEFKKVKEDYVINKWKITDEQMRNWTRLSKDCPKDRATDCVINVGTFFDLIDRPTAEIIAQELNSRRMGTHVERFIPAMEMQILRDQRIKTQHVNIRFQPDDDIFTEIRKSIGRNHATILELIRKSGKPGLLGHAVILAVSDNGEGIIIDPQQQVFYRGPDIYDYLRKEGIVTFGIYARNKRAKRPFKETETQVKKKTPSPQSHKRRRIHSPPKEEPNPSAAELLNVSKEKVIEAIAPKATTRRKVKPANKKPANKKTANKKSKSKSTV
jgi:hypothetical protein